MHLLTNLSAAQPIAYAILILSFLALAGLMLGEVKVRGIKLGVAGVLFAGIVFGHFHLSLPPETLGFVRELGLILFVYTIGLQVGPGFFTSLRKQGLPLNLLALAVVLGGAALTLLMARLGHIDMAAAVGIFSGATTNTPSLGAAQEALKQALGSDVSRAGLPALGYAVAYPFGIIGIVLSMLLLRSFLRIRPEEELKAFERAQESEHASLQRMNIRVCNRNLIGLRLHEIPGREALGVTVSRIKYLGEPEVSVANGETVLHEGDVMLAVGTPTHLHEFCLIVGEESPQDLMEFPGPVTFERCVVTRKDLLGKTLRQLQFTEQYGVTVTRVLRGDVELSAVPNITLQFGDLLQVVGRADDLQKVAALVGNSVKELNHTNFISMFLGIGLGVLLGLWPFTLGNMPMPVRLGLAGGPLVAAIVLSRLGRIGPLVWYMPPNANLALREFGITLFLACAGLKAGEHFVEVFFLEWGWQEFIHGGKDKSHSDLFVASHELAAYVPLLQANHKALEVLSAFELGQLATVEFAISVSQSLANGTERQGIGTFHGLISPVSRGWSILAGMVAPVERLTIPGRVLEEQDFDDVLTLEIRTGEETTPSLGRIETLLKSASKLYTSIARATSNADAEPLTVVYLTSGSGFRFDLKGMGEPIKRLKELLVEIWEKIRHRKADDFHHNVKAVVTGLDVLAKIGAHKHLDPETRLRLAHDITDSMLNLFETGALPREVRSVEVVSNAVLIQDFRKKLLTDSSVKDVQVGTSAHVRTSKRVPRKKT